MSMHSPTPLEERIMAAECRNNFAAIEAAANDPTIPWEDVSALASQQNARMMRMLETIPEIIDRRGDDAAMQAIGMGIRMFNSARENLGDEFVPDLVEGINAFGMRAKTAFEAGHPIPMHYMDMNVRKMLLLVEGAFKQKSKGK